MFRKTLLIAGVALLLSAPQAMAAEDWQRELRSELERMGVLTEESLQKLGRALNEALGKVPRYAMPEVLPNGDIIIRRLPDAKPKADEPDTTETRI